MPKRNTGNDMDAEMRAWASVELDGQEVNTTEARQIVAAYHSGGIEGFARNYNTDYGTEGIR